jgi:hypothetical protein
MRAWAEGVIAVVATSLAVSSASCVGDEFSAAGSGGAGATSTTAAGDGGGASASSSSGPGGAGGGAGTSTTTTSSATTAATTSSAGGSGAAASSSTSGAGGAETSGAGGGPLLGFCEANGALHDFCDDFDGGDLLAGWDDALFEAPITATLQTSSFASPPASYEVASLMDAQGSWGIAGKEHPGVPAYSRLEATLLRTGVQFGGAHGAVGLLAIAHDGNLADVGVDDMGFYLRFTTAQVFVTHLPPIPTGQWVRVALEVKYRCSPRAVRSRPITTASASGRSAASRRSATRTRRTPRFTSASSTRGRRLPSPSASTT